MGFACGTLSKLFSYEGAYYAQKQYEKQQICVDSKGGHPLRWGIFDEYVRF